MKQRRSKFPNQPCVVQVEGGLGAAAFGVLRGEALRSSDSLGGAGVRWKMKW
jgi:hypothetical protein